MSGFLVNGIDLDTLFAPIGSCTKIADTGFLSAGSDISNLYAGAEFGTPYGTTNIFKNNSDIGTLFAAYGSLGPATLFLYAWGGNSDGQTAITTPIYSWNIVSAGTNHSTAIRSDGRLFTWGGNASGQLGLINSWTSISSGFHTAAIRSDGILFTWGVNTQGALGDGSTIDKS
ncbi:MAG: hypothetical protein ACOVOV_11490, partial [Dolichospermum sp.]